MGLVQLGKTSMSNGIAQQARDKADCRLPSITKSAVTLEICSGIFG